jgi:hypothetical protein
MSSFKGQSISLNDASLSLLDQLSSALQMRYSEVVRVLIEEKSQQLGIYPAPPLVENAQRR